MLEDGNTFIYGYIGSRATGSEAGDYMVVGPHWKGEKPPGIKKVFHATTQFGLVGYRTQLFDPADIPNVRRSRPTTRRGRSQSSGWDDLGGLLRHHESDRQHARFHQPDRGAATKRSVALRSLAVTFGIVVGVSVAGNLIFKLFGISLATLRITGGVVLFIIGYQMLQGAGAQAHKPSDADVAESKDAQLSVAVSPLAIPMLAGPGTIATAMNFAAGGWLHIAAISLASFAVICGATYACFHYSDRLVVFLGQNGMNVVTRLMGLIVASIGVSMLLQGLGYHTPSG